jgi:hypothetical protein
LPITVAAIPQPSASSRATGADDRPLVAGGERRGGERVDVVHRADAACAGRVRADAVLGVDDVVSGAGVGVGPECRAQRADRPQHPLPHRLAVHLRQTSTRTAASSGRKNPVSPPRPRVHTVTSTPAPASALANAKVCTTEPRGLVE